MSSDQSSQFLWNGSRRNPAPTRSLSYDEESQLNDEAGYSLDRVEQEKLESDINRLINQAKETPHD